MPPELSANPALKNRLLAALPEDEFGRVNHHLEFVSLKLGHVLHETGDKMNNVYFSNDGDNVAAVYHGKRGYC